MYPQYFENKFILIRKHSLSNEINLNGICKIKNKATIKLGRFKANALLMLPLANSQNALVVPQNGHSKLNNLSIKQKCGNRLRILIKESLNKRKVEIIRTLLAKMLISF